MQRTFRWLAVTVCLSAAVNVLEEPRLGARADTRASQADAGPSLRDYYSANGLLNRGLYDLAAAEYRKFLSKHEDHEKAPVARYGLAVSLFRMKQYDAAAQELEPLHRRQGLLHPGGFRYLSATALRLPGPRRGTICR